MPLGYNGKILKVDLTNETIEIDEPGEDFFRKYMGGSALGTYYVFKETSKGVDPLGPDNVIAFSASVVSGAPAPCLSRFNINAKSPLTGAIGDTQGGGWWAPELKFAGFDAVIVKGKASKPKYLWIKDGEVEVRDAEHLWGMTTGEAEAKIREDHGDEKIRVAGIGQAGENMVKYACVINERKHANGRTGMGAVMGSKNLKAIAVRGDKDSIEYADDETLSDYSKKAPGAIKEHPVMRGLQEYGTNSGLVPQQEAGGLPTKNFISGVFDGYEGLSAEKMHETIFVKRETCYRCPVACKRVVELDEPYEVDPRYGGPEYETVAALGSYNEVGDMEAIAKGNELCNKYSLDTISTGAAISFAIECFENGILNEEDTDGLKLEFGNPDIVLDLIEKITHRDGIGDLLAEGPQIAAEKIGKGAEKYAMHVKGNPLPAHMPRVKRGLGLIYAVNPFGADHVSSDQDQAYTATSPDIFLEEMKSYGLDEPLTMTELSTKKVKLMYYSQQYFSLMDTLVVCAYGYGSVFLFGKKDLANIVEAVTGWNVNLWELMKVGERRTNLMRKFNAREGFTNKDDTLPDRLFEELKEGASKGQAVDRETFENAKKEYYEMAVWDSETGNPTNAKLKELGLEWMIE